MTHGEVYRLNRVLRAEGKKFCNRCEQTRLILDFAGQGVCRECRSTYIKRYAKVNRKRLRAKNKAYRLANRKVIFAMKKAYRQKNREALSAKKKEYYKANREAILARVKKYADAHREEIRQYKARLFITFKRALTIRLECLRQTSPAFREARIEEILTWAGERHSYWVESEIQNVIQQLIPKGD